MRRAPTCPDLPCFVPAIVVLAAAAGLAGCAITPGPGAGLGAAPRPAYYIAAPPPGERRCVEFREDMYGRRYCSKYYPS